MQKRVLLFLLLSIVAYASPYAKCKGCHGNKGEKPALVNKSKIIADMTQQEIIDAMVGYKNDTYGGPMKALMKAQSMSLSENDIETIANMIGK